MTNSELKTWNDKAERGEIADELNPAYILQGVSTELLSKIAKGEINAQELAKRELENRGLNIDGIWIGFNGTIK